jgi:hypothetical protein
VRCVANFLGFGIISTNILWDALEVRGFRL